MCGLDPSQASIRHVGKPAEPAQGDNDGSLKRPRTQGAARVRRCLGSGRAFRWAATRPQPGVKPGRRGSPSERLQAGGVCGLDPSQASIRRVGKPAEPAQGDLHKALNAAPRPGSSPVAPRPPWPSASNRQLRVLRPRRGGPPHAKATRARNRARIAAKSRPVAHNRGNWPWHLAYSAGCPWHPAHATCHFGAFEVSWGSRLALRW